MKWNKIAIFGFFFSVLFSVFFVSPSYAIEDLTRSFSADDSYTIGTPLFPDCDSACLGNYKYLITSNPSADYLNTNNLVQLQWRPGYSSQRMMYIPSSFSLVIYDLSFEANSGAYLRFGSNGKFTSDVTFTLTDNYNSCPEVEPCPVVPENPYDDKLDKIIQAIYVVAGTLLVIYFFYCIYRMIIKPLGGH